MLKKLIITIIVAVGTSIALPAFSAVVSVDIGDNWHDWRWREKHHDDWMDWHRGHSKEWNEWRTTNREDWDRWCYYHPRDC